MVVDRIQNRIQLPAVHLTQDLLVGVERAELVHGVECSRHKSQHQQNKRDASERIFSIHKSTEEIFLEKITHAALGCASILSTIVNYCNITSDKSPALLTKTGLTVFNAIEYVDIRVIAFEVL